MITRQLLGTAQVPGGEELKLFAHGRDFMIVMGHNELMSTRMRGSEEALATMTLDRLKGRSDPHLLIGRYRRGSRPDPQRPHRIVTPEAFSRIQHGPGSYDRFVTGQSRPFTPGPA